MKITIHYIVLSLCTLVLNLSMLQAQEQPSLRQRADGFFLRMEYAKAVQLYEKLADGGKPKVGDVERIGMGYLYLNAYDLAENWLSRAVLMEGHGKETELLYAEALKHNGKYAEAKEVFRSYQDSYGATDQLKKELDGCDSAVVWMANPVSFDLRNEQEVNTDLAEFGAVPTSNGVIYTAEPKITSAARSGMTGQPYLKVFSASRNEATLSLPNVMPYAFNDAAYHVGPVAVNKNEDMLFVTRTYAGRSVQQVKEDGKRFLKHNLELKIYKNVGDNWVEEDFPYNDTESFSVGHAALSDNEDLLYFASNMPGGYGGTDIWYVERQNDGSWGAPKNAGNVINSAGDELFPAVYGSKLYYASDGFVGMGGLDVYVIEGERSSFRNRRNMRYPLNSAGDDFAYVVMADDDEAFYGYLSSNRKDGIGGDDIYSFYFEKPKVNITLQGLVYDKATNLTLADTRVSLIADDGAVVSRKISDAKGAFDFQLAKGKTYTLLGEKNGYMGDPVLIAASLPKADTIIQSNIYLSAMKTIGDKFVLENLYYDFDKANIRPDAALVLDKLVNAMRDNPTMKVELSSHTDSRGSDKYNMLLSDRRAKSALEYVVSRGIERSRIVAKGYGESRLVNSCRNGVKCTAAEHQANRRTEVEVLEY